MTRTKRKRCYKRGYPVALLVGLEEHHAVLWRVFSNIVKQCQKLGIDCRADKKTLYNFHESMVDALRPVLDEGVRSVIVTAPIKTTYAIDFMDHVQRHHSYLLQTKGQNKTTFAELTGSADQLHKVEELMKTKKYRKLIADTTSVEANCIVDALDEQLFGINGQSIVRYTLREIEDMIYGSKGQNSLKLSYLMLTDKYIAFNKEKNRIHRLLQISKNRKVKTKVVNAETSAGKRISQFGGLVFFALSESQR